MTTSTPGTFTHFKHNVMGLRTSLRAHNNGDDSAAAAVNRHTSELEKHYGKNVLEAAVEGRAISTTDLRDLYKEATSKKDIKEDVDMMVGAVLNVLNKSTVR